MPRTVIQPWTRPDQTLWVQPLQVADRSLEANRRRMQASDGRKPVVIARQAHDPRPAVPSTDDGHVHELRFAP